MFAIYQGGIGRFIGIGETEQAARDDARNLGSTDAADKAQLVRADDEFPGAYYIREFSRAYTDVYRTKGEIPWTVNDEGLIDVADDIL